MRLLLVDNYDSFTYNLFGLLAVAAGEEPAVARNDAIPLAALERGDFDGVVISPGPGRPGEEADFGGCAGLIRAAAVPVLGVCLGHQGIAVAHGGEVRRSEPVHGRATWISHEGGPIFAGVPRRFRAVRYHSLAVAEPLPEGLRATARSEDGAVMALAHAERPLWGVQFHPESAGTPLGGRMIENFVELVERHGADRRRSSPGRNAPGDRRAEEEPTHRIVVRSLPHPVDPAAAFEQLFGDDEFAFWIDREAGGGGDGGSSCSLIGSAATAGSEVLTYEVASGAVTALSPAGDSMQRIEGTIFEVLRGRLAERRIAKGEPFSFAPGYVGYLGYELKADLGSPGRHRAAAPDACLIYAPRLVVFDHRSGETHALVVVGPEDNVIAAEADAEALRRRLASLAEPAGPPRDSPTDTESPPIPPGAARFALDRDEYLAAVAAAQRQLRAGESYEICLTNRIGVDLGRSLDPLELYLRLRSHSPAPEAAYLRCGETALLSASPERFLRITEEGRVRTSPIKGTRPRGADPRSDRALREELAASAKEQAENMMIVDVLRNDLGRVCAAGSVQVERLMEVESFAQVHQLVSTVSGRLARGRDAVDCVEACFPGGSMTGAPKLRSMEIIDALEPCARGPYSGALGCFSLAGAADLSIVIRSITVQDGRAEIGSGGAITVLSDPAAEHAEMLLKAQPLLEAASSLLCAV